LIIGPKRALGATFDFLFQGPPTVTDRLAVSVLSRFNP
jgi:hypothetical protein